MAYTPPKPWFSTLVYRTMHPLAGLLCRLLWRVEAHNQEALATSTGPMLLLPNHTSTFDPVWAGYFAWRRLGFMASAQLFRYKALSMLIGALGAFPKSKFVKDKDAMAHMQRIWDMGHVVLIFPEGTRTWDGRTRPVIPGIGRLIKRMDAKVVYCRIQTGHYHHPRWARYPRLVPVRVEYDGPYDYEDKAQSELDDIVSEKIRIDPNPKVEGWSWGFRMAHGFPTYMWGCPHCHALRSLDIHPKDDNAVLCGGCGAAWRLDPFNQMHPLPGTPVEGQAVEDIITHRDRLVAALGEPPIADQARLDAEGIALQEPGWVGKVTHTKDPEHLADGQLTLTRETLEVRDEQGEVLWSTPLKSLVAVSYELAGVLQVRGRNKLYVQLTPKTGSTVMWGHFIAHWAKAAGARKIRFG